MINKDAHETYIHEKDTFKYFIKFLHDNRPGLSCIYDIIELCYPNFVLANLMGNKYEESARNITAFLIANRDLWVVHDNTGYILRLKTLDSGNGSISHGQEYAFYVEISTEK